MTVETYKEFFDYTAFPVLATLRGTNKIVYKNYAFAQHFPGFTRQNLSKIFFCSKDSREIGPVRLGGFGAYHTALALEDGNHTVFLFLSHLQYDTGMYYANRIVQTCGDSLTDFLSSVQSRKNVRTPTSRGFASGRSLYTETFDLLLDERDMNIPIKTSLYQAADCIFRKISSSFSDFGYRVSAEIEEDLPQYLQTLVPLQEILFCLGKLLYLQMKLSKTKDVRVFLSCDPAFSRYVFHITTETALSELPCGFEESEEWLKSNVPECSMEFSFLYRSGILDGSNFTGKLDSFGYLTLLYSTPYLSPETYYVRSADPDDVLLLRLIDGMLESLRAGLTDSGASC